MKTFLTRNFFFRTVFSTALASALLTSCQDEDFGYSSDQIKYAKNFTDLYGEIPADKSWDMSSFANWVDVCSNSGATRSGGSPDPTKGSLEKDTHYKIGNDWYEVDQNLLSWMSSKLTEGYDNRYLGSSFVLKVPETNNFAIIPIFQGNSSITSQLEVKINGYNITKIWEKSENMQAIPADGTEYKQLGHFGGSSDWKYVQYQTKEWTQADQDNFIANRRSDVAENLFAVGETVTVPYYPLLPASTIGVKAVHSKPIVFDRSRIDLTSGSDYMYLSLKNIGKSPELEWKKAYWSKDEKWIVESWHTDDNKAGYLRSSKMWDANNTWTTIGDRLTSINPGGYMLALNVPNEVRPSASKLRKVLGLAENGTEIPQCIIVGCEDANGRDSDHDNNDVVFLIVGYPNAPQIVPTTEVVRKRYMCEDLGGTDDFDFNDVVVDLTQTRDINIEYSGTVTKDVFFNENNGEQPSVEIAGMTKSSTVTQTAKIVHVCGTLPLQVRVGNYFFPVIEDPTNEFGTRSALSGPGYIAGSAWTRGEVKGDGWNPNEEKTISDYFPDPQPGDLWDPVKNNIKVYVDWSSRPEKMQTYSDEFKLDATEDRDAFKFADYSSDSHDKRVVTFPANGRVPYIIAMDVDVPWMKERQHVPVDWLSKGDMSSFTDADGNAITMPEPSSGAYYENYGSDLSEAILWTGSAKGLANITVADLSGATYKAGIKEAHGKYFNIINVYTREAHTNVNTSVVGRIKLAYKDGTTWKPLFGSEVLGLNYIHPELALQSGAPSAGVYKTSIMLTDSQLNRLEANGLGVISMTNGMEIVKVSMYRIWDPETLQGADGGCYQKGRSLIVKSGGNGTVMVNDRASDEKDFGESAYEVIYPYSVVSYSQYQGGFNNSKHDQLGYNSQVTLRAYAKPGFAFSKWQDENHDNPRTINIEKASSELEYTAIFAEASDPNFALSAGSLDHFVYDAKNKVYSIALPEGAEYPVSFSTDNSSTPFVIGNYDNRVMDIAYAPATNLKQIKIHAVGEGEQTFTIQQPDGRVDDSHLYNASEVINIKVKVVKVPSLADDKKLAGWMIREWSGGDKNAYIVSQPTSGSGYQLPNGTDITADWDKHIFSGDAFGSYTYYIDFPQAEWLVAKVNSGSPIFNFNQQKGDGQYAASNGGRFSVSTTSNTDYLTVVENADNSKTYLINLKAIREKQGYLHLTSINIPDGQTANVEWVKVDNNYSPLRARWDDMKEKISSAKRDLTVSDIYEWTNATGNATTDGTQRSDRYLWKDADHPTAEKGEVIYGDTWTLCNNYVDLSSTSVIVATVPKNGCEIEFAFNKQLGSGDGANYNGSADSVRPGAENRYYCSVVADGDNYHYVIDAAGLRQHLSVNYLHLNFIRVPYYDSDSYVTHIVSLKVDSYSAPDTDAAAIAALEATADAGLTDPNKDYDNMGDDIRYNWQKWKVGEKYPNKNVECDVVYGAINDIQTKNQYDDMDNPAAKYIKVTVYSGYDAPRFFFNHTENTEGFVIQITENTKYLLHKTNSDGSISYYIDLGKIRSDKGHAYLNSVRSSYGNKIKVSEFGLGIKWPS